MFWLQVFRGVSERARIRENRRDRKGETVRGCRSEKERTWRIWRGEVVTNIRRRVSIGEEDTPVYTTRILRYILHGSPSTPFC